MDFFYQPELAAPDQQIQLSEMESKHLSRVLRKKPGDTIGLLNGIGGTATGQLLSTDPKGCLVQITSFEQAAPPPYTVHIAMAPTKSNDRFEWFLEKATEIGITQITPLLCQHSERRKINPERFERIILSATKQSKQPFKPILNPLTSFEDFVLNNSDCLLAHCRSGNKKGLLNEVPLKPHTTLLIGPEGDFTQDEINLAFQQGATAIQLGAQRFRTETAGIVACHTLAIKAEWT